MKSSSLKNIKRVFSLLIICAVVLNITVFSSCSISRGSALVVNGTSISNDVLLYFTDAAYNDFDGTGGFDAVKSLTLKKAETYFKTNTLFHNEKLSLSMAQKAKVSEQVNAYWGIYGEYYTKIGVTKETLTKVFSADAYRDALLLHYYDVGGPDEVGDASLYANFRTNYIVFRIINGYFTYMDPDGNNVRLNENDIEEIVLKFQNMASLINAGEKTMDDAAAFLAESDYTSAVSTVILKKDSTDYPAGFFTKVQKTEAQKAAVIGTTEYIFLVQREDAGVDDSRYIDKKAEILAEIKGEEIKTRIEASLTAESKTNDSDLRSFYLLIEKEKAS